MDNSIKELGKLRESIISGKISEKKLRESIDKIKKEYGEEVFKAYDLNAVRQYTYSKAYYDRLVQLAKNGASSQEFFIHLLRVRDAVKTQKIKKILLCAVCCIFTCCSIATLIVSFKNNSLLKEILVAQNIQAITQVENLETEKIINLDEEKADEVEPTVESETIISEEK